jgi:hypothetical protein
MSAAEEGEISSGATTARTYNAEYELPAKYVCSATCRTPDHALDRGNGKRPM